MESITTTMASTSSPAHQEIDAAISYLLSHLKSVIKPSSTSSANLRRSFTILLEQRYESHWHTSDPEKGSAYRALTRSKANLDSLIVKAFKDASIKLALKEVAEAMTASMGADKWTLWIDPGCVSIRMHGSGGIHFSSASDSAFSPSSNKVNMSGIIEIWGKLPASVSGIQAVIPHPVPAPSSAHKRPKTPLTNKRSTINLRQNEAASLAAEFEALAFNASPVKKSKAIAIIRPDSASSPATTPAPSHSMLSATAVPQQLLHKGLAGFSNNAATVATPPRAFPPLSFTIQESTSPYVPSFAGQVAAAAAASTAADAGSDSCSSAASSGSETARTATPLDSLALNSVDSAPTGNGAASDPFARPSSRSSTTSIASATSCSIFSHASSESRSSSIGSYSPLSSSSPEELAAMAAMKVPFSSANSSKASPGEMDAAMSFTFPPPSSTHGSLAAPASLPMSLNGSAPNSPSKPRRPRHHSRAMSTSSNISATSSSPATSSSNTAERPNHMRKTSSRTEVRVDTSDNIVQDYSNGKVGVLGGGVKLGLMGGSSSGNNKRENKHRRTASSASNVSSATFNSMSSAATATGEFKRPRNPSRTHSNDADLFRMQQHQAQQAYYTNNYHQQQHQHNQHNQHNQHQRIPSGSYWNMDPYAAASSVVYQH
jgi:hypothetical protein